MVSKWLSGYVNGPYEALKQWEFAMWPPAPSYDEEGNEIEPTKSARPHAAFRSTPAHVFNQDGTGTDDEGNEYPVFAPDESRSDVLVLFSVLPNEAQHLDALDAMDGVTVYRGATHTDIIAALPEFTIGQSIPHLS